MIKFEDVVHELYLEEALELGCESDYSHSRTVLLAGDGNKTSYATICMFADAIPHAASKLLLVCMWTDSYEKVSIKSDAVLIAAKANVSALELASKRPDVRRRDRRLIRQFIASHLEDVENDDLKVEYRSTD